MPLKTLVKVGSITNLSDARYCAGMGVEMLGFCLDKNSSDYVDHVAYKEIVGWVSGPKFVGEFESVGYEEILEISEELKLDLIQLADLELANRLANTHSIIFKIDLSGISLENELNDLLSKSSEQIKYILVESSPEVSTSTSEKIAQLSYDYPILKGYNSNAGSILQEVDGNDFVGIALKGSQELKPGFKDYDELADILEALEDDD